MEDAHLYGCVPAQIMVGLVSNSGKLMSAMGFNKQSSTEWFMVRYATALGYAVVGGASKLFAYFVHEYKPKSVITYSDIDTSDASVYIQLGFKEVGRTTPNYLIIDDRTGIRLGKCVKLLDRALGCRVTNLIYPHIIRYPNSGSFKLLWTGPNQASNSAL